MAAFPGSGGTKATVSVRPPGSRWCPGSTVAALVVAALVLAAAALPEASAAGGADASGPATAAGPLDGRRFRAGIVRAEDGRRDDDAPLLDRLIFDNGAFSSEICRRYNFRDAPYWVRREGEQIHFLVTLESPTDGVMVWQGTVRDDALEGTMRWTKRRWYWTIEAEHRIRGTLETGSGGAAPGTD